MRIAFPDLAVTAMYKQFRMLVLGYGPGSINSRRLGLVDGSGAL
jgi:hypothetical protein